MNSLKDYIAKGKNRPRSVSETELRRFLTAHADSVRLHETGNKNYGRTGMKIVIGLGLVALLSGALLVTSLQFDGEGGKTDEGKTEVGGQTGGEGKRSGASVFYFSGCPLDDVWRYDVGTSRFAPASVAGQPMLELSESELRALGIERLKEGGVNVYVRSFDGKGVERVTLSHNDAGSRPLSGPLPPGIVPGIDYPMLATDNRGRRRFAHFTYQEIDSALNKRIQRIYTKTWEAYGHLIKEGKEKEYERLVKETGVDTLKEQLHRKAEREFLELEQMIPLRIPSDRPFTRRDSLNGECPRTVILWYRAAPEFLALLPTDWRDRMKGPDSVSGFSQASLATGMEQGEKTEKPTVESPIPHVNRSGEVSSPRKSLRRRTPNLPAAEDPVSGSEQGANPSGRSGAILSPLVSPMPIRGEGTLQLQLGESRRVALSLHNVSGTLLTLLMEDRSLQSGTHTLPLRFDGIPSGIYLLAISTDRGELRLLRILVE